MDDPDELLNATRAAEYKKVTRQGVIKAINDGRLPAHRWGYFWVIRRADLDAWQPLAGYPKGRPRKKHKEENK